MLFKTRIKEIRTCYGLTQEELADKVGVTRQTMLYIEKGKYNPSLIVAIKIARVLKSRIEDLYIFNED